MIRVGRSIERKRCEERITAGDARGGAGGAEQKKITLSDGDTTATATTAIIRVCVVACCCCVAAVFESQQRTTRGVCEVWGAERVPRAAGAEVEQPARASSTGNRNRRRVDLVTYLVGRGTDNVK